MTNLYKIIAYVATYVQSNSSGKNKKQMSKNPALMDKKTIGILKKIFVLLKIVMCFCHILVRFVLNKSRFSATWICFPLTLFTPIFCKLNLFSADFIYTDFMGIKFSTTLVRWVLWVYSPFHNVKPNLKGVFSDYILNILLIICIGFIGNYRRYSLGILLYSIFQIKN